MPISSQSFDLQKLLVLWEITQEGLIETVFSELLHVSVYLWPLYFKVSLAGYKICGSYFLSLNILNVLLHCLLASSAIL